MKCVTFERSASSITNNINSSGLGSFNQELPTMAPTSNLAAFLVLSAAATPACGAFAFAPSSRGLLGPIRPSASSLSASTQDENEVVDGWRKITGGAAAFLTGMGIMAQVAFADQSGVFSFDTGEFELKRLAGEPRECSVVLGDVRAVVG